MIWWDRQDIFLYKCHCHWLLRTFTCTRLLNIIKWSLLNNKSSLLPYSLFLYMPAAIINVAGIHVKVRTFGFCKIRICTRISLCNQLTRKLFIRGLISVNLCHLCVIRATVTFGSVAQHIENSRARGHFFRSSGISITRELWQFASLEGWLVSCAALYRMLGLISSAACFKTWRPQKECRENC